MERKNGGLRISLRPISGVSQLHTVASGIPVSLILLLGLSLTISDWFPSVSVPWWYLFTAALAVSAALWMLQLTGKGRWICFGALIAVAAVCVLAHESVLSGFGSLGNDLLDRLTCKTGRIYLDFAAGASGSVLWAVIPVLCITAVLVNLSMQTGSILFCMPVLLPVYAAVLTDFLPVNAGTVLVGLGSILLVMIGANRKAEGQGLMGAPTWLAVTAMCILAALAVGAFSGEADLTAGAERLESLIHDMLYDRDTNSMPEGDLKNLQAWDKNDTSALEITMTDPQKVYLRGQVYETYTGTSWETLSAEETAEYESLFYWLHKSGFFGQSQIGTASIFTMQAEPSQMTIKNLSACSAHGYYPYALYGSEMLDAGLIGDTDFPATEAVSYLTGSVPQWYGVQNALASAQGRTNVSQYLAAEEAYEQYVQTVDVQLTNESWAVLDRQLGEDDTPKTLSQIREYIRSYLADALVYDEEVKTLNGNEDFLQYVLEKSGSGYSVHYATAAVLMLRYFGVPARYVEGYFLSAEEAAAYQAGETIILTEKHAHAWAEYYLPGVGFVPFEVTPGYIDDEDLELGGSIAQDEQTYTGDHLKYAQVEQPERIEEPEQDRFSFSMKPVYLLALLLILLIVLFVLILIKRLKLKQAFAAIASADNREAISMRYGYAVRLSQSCGGTSVEGAERAEKLNREALFSNREMTQEQRDEMDSYAQRVLHACKEKWTVLEKIRYRVWDCLY